MTTPQLRSIAQQAASLRAICDEALSQEGEKYDRSILRRTGRIPNIETPTATELLARIARTASNPKHAQMLVLVEEHLRTQRTRVQAAFTKAIQAALSLERLGGLSDEIVEERMALAYERCHAQHCEKLEISLRRSLTKARGPTASHQRGPFKPEATALLELAYSKSQHLNSAEIRFLAKHTGITPTQFQNRRNRNVRAIKDAAIKGTTPPPPVQSKPQHRRIVSALNGPCEEERDEGSGVVPLIPSIQHTPINAIASATAVATPAGSTTRPQAQAQISSSGREVKDQSKKRKRKQPGGEDLKQSSTVPQPPQPPIVPSAAHSTSARSVSSSSISEVESHTDWWMHTKEAGKPNEIIVPHGPIFAPEMYTYGYNQEQMQMAQRNGTAGGEWVQEYVASLGAMGGYDASLGGEQGWQGVNEPEQAGQALPNAFAPFYPAQPTSNLAPLLSANLPPSVIDASSTRSTPSIGSSAGRMEDPVDPFKGLLGDIDMDLGMDMGLNKDMEMGLDWGLDLQMDMGMDLNMDVDMQMGEWAKTLGNGMGDMAGDQDGGKHESNPRWFNDMAAFLDIPDSPFPSSASWASLVQTPSSGDDGSSPANVELGESTDQSSSQACPAPDAAFGGESNAVAGPSSAISNTATIAVSSSSNDLPSAPQVPGSDTEVFAELDTLSYFDVVRTSEFDFSALDLSTFDFVSAFSSDSTDYSLTYGVVGAGSTSAAPSRADSAGEARIDTLPPPPDTIYPASVTESEYEYTTSPRELFSDEVGSVAPEQLPMGLWQDQAERSAIDGEGQERENKQNQWMPRRIPSDISTVSLDLAPSSRLSAYSLPSPSSSAVFEGQEGSSLMITPADTETPAVTLSLPTPTLPNPPRALSRQEAAPGPAQLLEAYQAQIDATSSATSEVPTSQTRGLKRSRDDNEDEDQGPMLSGVSEAGDADGEGEERDRRVKRGRNKKA